jgi:Domain of unknown function (DU1801)
LKLKEKNKMQKVSFNSVDDFLDYLPADELEIVQYLRKIVYNCIPGIEENLSYNVPFFKKNKNICFVWPASVLWGKKKTYEGVRFGFAYGNLLSDEIGYLEKDERKQVYWKVFTELKQIDVDLLKMYIFEAAVIDEQCNNKRKRDVRKK